MRSRSGYSFAEVLFAVAVLGIGFIMVAGIFPAAILQTQAAMEETVGTAVTRNGISYLRGSPTLSSAYLPYTSDGLPAAPTPPNPGRVFGFHDDRILARQLPAGSKAPPALWDSIKQNLIVADDPRYAYVPMYIRDEGSTFAKLIVIGVRVRNQSAFKPEDLERPTSAVANLEPKPVKVTLREGTGQPNPVDTIVIANMGGTTLNTKDAAVEGAYVIISDDNVPDDALTPFTNEHGKLNGRVYRLGAQIAQDTYELATGDDMPSFPGQDGVLGNTDDIKEDMTDATALIVGRGYADPTDGTRYDGPSMAVQRYENVIALP